MSSTAGDFRNLTRLVLMDALKEAGTRVCEPIHRFHLEIPPDTFGPTSSLLARLGAVSQTQEMRGSSYILDGEIPASRVHELEQQLPALTRGKECYWSPPSIATEKSAARSQPDRGRTITR
jgi:ribosomal protection tetracycline resistance protein